LRLWWVPCLMLLPATALGQGVDPDAPAAPAPASAAPTPSSLPPSVAPPVPLGQHPSLPPPGALPPRPPPPPIVVPPDPTVHRHLGFFFRADVGVGYLRGSTGSRTGSGVALPAGLAVGGAVTENLIFAGEMWGAFNMPSQTVNGQTFNSKDTTMVVGGAGLNVTYYLMPLNAYVSLTPSVTVLSIATPSGSPAAPFPDVESTAGFGLKVSLGKEWWVRDHWGLGLALEFTFSTNKEKGTNPPSWTSFAGGLTASATYN